MKSVTTAAKEALEYGYSNAEANRSLAILVHNGFANGTLVETDIEIHKAIEACSKHNSFDEDFACPDCNGQGYFQGTGDNMDIDECPECGGTGFVEAIRMIPCANCSD